MLSENIKTAVGMNQTAHIYKTPKFHCAFVVFFDIFIYIITCL